MERFRQVELKHQAHMLVRHSPHLAISHEKKLLDPSFICPKENPTKLSLDSPLSEETYGPSFEPKGPSVVPTKSLRVSTFIPPGLTERLGWVDPSHYLLCVGYGDTEDFQIGISGTCWKGEDEETTLEREVQEETGLAIKTFPTYEDFGKVRRFNPRFRAPRTYAYFALTPSSLTPACFPFNPIEKMNDKARKVVVLIHGPLKEIQDLIVTICERPGFATDGIDRYAALSVQDAIDLATHLPSTCGM